MADQQVHMRVWRGDAEGGEFRDYRIAVGEGMVVLDVIHAIQAQQANDLAVRWNCKAGKCGSCSAEVNGKPGLMCMTRMSTFGRDETVTVTPLRTNVTTGPVPGSPSGACGARSAPPTIPPACTATEPNASASLVLSRCIYGSGRSRASSPTRFASPSRSPPRAPRSPTRNSSSRRHR